ncbi:MAG: hypothetical protein ACXVRZ_11545 [Gaiellaceae bacterium]
MTVRQRIRRFSTPATIISKLAPRISGVMDTWIGRVISSCSPLLALDASCQTLNVVAGFPVHVDALRMARTEKF